MDGQRQLAQRRGEMRPGQNRPLKEGEVIRRKREDVTSWQYPARSVRERVADMQPLPKVDIRDQERLTELRIIEEQSEGLQIEEDSLGFVFNRPVFSSQGGEKTK